MARNALISGVFRNATAALSLSAATFAVSPALGQHAQSGTASAKVAVANSSTPQTNRSTDRLIRESDSAIEALKAEGADLINEYWSEAFHAQELRRKQIENKRDIDTTQHGEEKVVQSLQETRRRVFQPDASTDVIPNSYFSFNKDNYDPGYGPLDMIADHPDKIVLMHVVFPFSEYSLSNAKLSAYCNIMLNRRGFSNLLVIEVKAEDLPEEAYNFLDTREKSATSGISTRDYFSGGLPHTAVFALNENGEMERQLDFSMAISKTGEIISPTNKADLSENGQAFYQDLKELAQLTGPLYAHASQDQENVTLVTSNDPSP